MKRKRVRINISASEDKSPEPRQKPRKAHPTKESLAKTILGQLTPLFSQL